MGRCHAEHNHHDRGSVGTKLAATYQHYYGNQEARFATILDAGARLIIERISTSDALYHNVEHTILVTLVGQDILRGRLLHQAVQPSDWLHFMFALLCQTLDMCVAGVWETKSKARSLMKLEKGCNCRAVPATRC